MAGAAVHAEAPCAISHGNSLLPARISNGQEQAHNTLLGSPHRSRVMKSSLQVARGLVALLIATGLCASVYAQAPGKERSAPPQAANAKVERVPVAAVNVEAHLKSRVVSSVTVGAPIEQAAPAVVAEPQVVLKGVIAAR